MELNGSAHIRTTRYRPIKKFDSQPDCLQTLLSANLTDSFNKHGVQSTRAHCYRPTRPIAHFAQVREMIFFFRVMISHISEIECARAFVPLKIEILKVFKYTRLARHVQKIASSKNSCSSATLIIFSVYFIPQFSFDSEH